MNSDPNKRCEPILLSTGHMLFIAVGFLCRRGVEDTELFSSIYYSMCIMVTDDSLINWKYQFSNVEAYAIILKRNPHIPKIVHCSCPV